MNLYARVTVDVEGVNEDGKQNVEHLAMYKREDMEGLITLVGTLCDMNVGDALNAVSSALAADPEACITALVGRGVTAVRNAAKAAASRKPGETGTKSALKAV